MSYNLDLNFQPALPPARVVKYFAERPHFTVESGAIFYGNEHTQGHFSVKLRAGRSFLSRQAVVAAEFEINYCPSKLFRHRGGKGSR